MSDIVERLRRITPKLVTGLEKVTLNEAVDEIERLRKINDHLTDRHKEYVAALDKQFGTPCEQIRHEQEIERLREALKPFASAACDALDTTDDDDWDAWEHPVAMAVKIGHFRNARAALSVKETPEND